MSTLQEKIRDEFLEKYLHSVDEALSKLLEQTTDDDRKNDYIQRIKHTAKLYLSTTLYRYFFPFLSHEDEEQICNGLSLFFHKMMWDTFSPFAKVYNNEERNDAFAQDVDILSPKLDNADYSAIIQNPDVEKAKNEAVNTLRTLINGFQGIEVFYEVSVDFVNRNRQIHSIRLVEDPNVNSEICPIHCIFKPATQE